MKPSVLRLTLVLGALAAFAPMSIDMYLPGLPALADAFHADAGAVELTLSAFFAGLVCGQVVYGPLSDRFGRRRPLALGIVVYVLASVGCALASSLTALIALRFVQALGGCAGLVISRALVRDLFDAQESARMFSLIMLVMGAAPILAPLAGGVLLVGFGWRSIFWALALFGLLVLAASAAWMPETRRGRGEALSVSQTLRGYAHMLADRRFLGYALAGGLAQAGMFAYITGSPSVFIEQNGVPPQHYGWLFGSNAFGLIAASQINRRLLVTHSAQRVLWRANQVNAAFGVLLLAAALSGAGGFIGLLVPLFGYVASLGFIGPNATALAMKEQGQRAGSAAALLGTLQFALAAVASAVLGLLHEASAVPMALAIAICGVLALTAHRAMGRNV